MPDQRQKVSAKIEGINWQDFVNPEDLEKAKVELGQLKGELDQLKSRVVESDVSLGKLEAEKRQWERDRAKLESDNRLLRAQLDDQITRPVPVHGADTAHAAAIETLTKQLETERGSVKTMEAQLQTCKKRIDDLESCKLAPTQEPMSPGRSVQSSPNTIPPPPPRPPQPPTVTRNLFGL